LLLSTLRFSRNGKPTLKENHQKHAKLMCRKNVQFSGAFALHRKKRVLASPRISFSKSVHLFTGIKSAIVGLISVKFDTGDLYEKSTNEIYILLKLNKNMI